MRLASVAAPVRPAERASSGGRCGVKRRARAARASLTVLPSTFCPASFAITPSSRGPCPLARMRPSRRSRPPRRPRRRPDRPPPAGRLRGRRISAASFRARSSRPPFVNCSIESLRCLTSAATTWRASASSRSRFFSTLLFMNAAFSIRSALETHRVVLAHRVSDGGADLVDQRHQSSFAERRCCWTCGTSWPGCEAAGAIMPGADTAPNGLVTGCATGARRRCGRRVLRRQRAEDAGTRRLLDRRVPRAARVDAAGRRLDVQVVEDGRQRGRQRDGAGRLVVVVVVELRLHHAVQLTERRGRRRSGCRRRHRGPRRGHGRHDDDAVEVRRVGDGDRARRDHVAAERSQQHVERLGFRDVRELDRDGPAGDALHVHDLACDRRAPIP